MYEAYTLQDDKFCGGLLNSRFQSKNSFYYCRSNVMLWQVLSQLLATREERQPLVLQNLKILYVLLPPLPTLVHLQTHPILHKSIWKLLTSLLSCVLLPRTTCVLLPRDSPHTYVRPSFLFRF